MKLNIFYKDKVFHKCLNFFYLRGDDLANKDNFDIYHKGNSIEIFNDSGSILFQLNKGEFIFESSKYIFHNGLLYGKNNNNEYEVNLLLS